MATRHLAGACAAALMAVTMAACGGSSGTPTSPSGGGGTGGSTGGSAAATITITASGVSPKSVTVAAGSRVEFVNNDTGRAHDMASDPHPIHTDCPEINLVGLLQVGQSRLTGNLNTVRTCGFHDHNLPDNASLQGTIIIR